MWRDSTLCSVKTALLLLLKATIFGINSCRTSGFHCRTTNTKIRRRQADAAVKQCSYSSHRQPLWRHSSPVWPPASSIYRSIFDLLIFYGRSLFACLLAFLFFVPGSTTAHLSLCPFLLLSPLSPGFVSSLLWILLFWLISVSGPHCSAGVTCLPAERVLV